MNAHTNAPLSAGLQPTEVTQAAHGEAFEPPKYVIEKCFSQGKSDPPANFSAPNAGPGKAISKPRKPQKPGRKAPSETELRLAEALYSSNPQAILRINEVHPGSRVTRDSRGVS